MTAWLPPLSTVAAQPQEDERMATIRKLWRRLRGDWWEPRRCCWPYPEGYATYNPARKTILDTGLTRDEAIAICANLNMAQQEEPR